MGAGVDGKRERESENEQASWAKKKTTLNGTIFNCNNIHRRMRNENTFERLALLLLSFFFSARSQQQKRHS